MLAAVLGDKGLGYFGDPDSSGWTSYAASGCEFARGLNPTSLATVVAAPSKLDLD